LLCSEIVSGGVLHDSVDEDFSLPIGSGVTEAACETLFTQRVKLSGMRWKRHGLQVVLNLRMLVLSGVWTEVYSRTLTLRSTHPIQAASTYPMNPCKTQHKPQPCRDRTQRRSTSLVGGLVKTKIFLEACGMRRSNPA
jgi:hypothetical protein